MEKETKHAIAETVKEMTDKANAMVAETRIQFDTLVTLQNDERKDMRESFRNERAKFLDAFQAETAALRKHYGRIIAGLLIALVILLGGIVGTVGYFMANFDFVSTTYQETHDSSQIQDGIHITANHSKAPI